MNQGGRARVKGETKCAESDRWNKMWFRVWRGRDGAIHKWSRVNNTCGGTRETSGKRCAKSDRWNEMWFRKWRECVRVEHRWSKVDNTNRGNTRNRQNKMC